MYPYTVQRFLNAHIHHTKLSLTTAILETYASIQRWLYFIYTQFIECKRDHIMKQIAHDIKFKTHYKRSV